MRLSASIGVALYPEHGLTPDSLISAADNAMHEAKRRGRNGYLFYSPDMMAQMRERMALEQGLIKAMEQQQFRLLYQPMTDLANDSLSGLEALVRWQHPSEGMISPARFIPVAEECGLIEQLGEWVMRTACQQGQRWLAEGFAVPRLSVNVSVREMRSPDYVDRVTAILAQTGFPAERLEIEVTESNIQSVDQSLSLFTRLKALGVQIAIDDFGTGFSSLSLLKSLPIDRIKIDRAFVQALPDDKHSRELCRTNSQPGRQPRHGGHGGRHRNPAPTPVLAVSALRGGPGLPVQPPPVRTPHDLHARPPALTVVASRDPMKKGAPGSLLFIPFSLLPSGPAHRRPSSSRRYPKV